MKFLILAILATTSFNYANATLRLGNSSISYEQFSEKIREEDSRSETETRNILRLNTKVTNNRFDDWHVGLPGQFELNLVFEDGRSVRGRIALSANAIDLADRYAKTKLEVGTFSLERMNGIVGDLVESYEDEYDSTVVRVDVISLQLNGPDLSDESYGLILGGTLGLSRISGNIGISRLYGDDASASITLKAEREKNVISFLNNDLDYSLWSLNADFQYYINSNFQAELFAKFENLSDYDRRDLDEERVSAGLKVQYFFLYNHGL